MDSRCWVTSAIREGNGKYLLGRWDEKWSYASEE